MKIAIGSMKGLRNLMIINFEEYKNKVKGCWMGKNIGGTLGGPFEGKRQINNVSFYTQELTGNPLPNDDLDLQLVWLNAIEKYTNKINASILGEYWLSYITPHCVEYGAGKANLRMGLVPPLSGRMNNIYKDSNGCFIRSEIWACIAPGHPEIAVKYAYEDAIADHSDEGVYAEVFCAAVESSAFVESDKYKLIDIGLSYIPENCGIAKGVKAALDSYKSGTSWEDARRNVLTAVPGSFGVFGPDRSSASEEIPYGKRGWDAPSNVGLMIIGWLYGEDDFGKSLCIAVNCGEDADCTAATLGSILGIVHGIDGIPDSWIEPIGDTIKTVCINLADCWEISIPGTVTELTERVLKLTPLFLGSGICDYLTAANGYNIEMLEPDDLRFKTRVKNIFKAVDNFKEFLMKGMSAVKYDFVIYNAVLYYDEEPYLKENSPKKFTLVLENNIWQQQWLNIKWHLPVGWSMTPSPNTNVFLDLNYIGNVQVQFLIEADNLNEGRYDLVIEITSNSHHTKGFIPIVLINGKH
jgi:ADP-ribosylglycohydrolase.